MRDDLFIGQIWKNKRGVERKITDMIHEGYDPYDDLDSGSFEQFNVYFEDGKGKNVVESFEFEIWIEDTEAFLICEPKNKIGICQLFRNKDKSIVNINSSTAAHLLCNLTQKMAVVGIATQSKVMI